MKVKIKTLDQLQSEGWRRTRDRYYLGETVGNAKYWISYFTSQYLPGREATIMDFRDEYRNGPDFLVQTDEGRQSWIPWNVIDGNCPANYAKIQHKFCKEKAFSNGKAKYYFANKQFIFDCDFKRMKLAEAKKVAKWILSMEKPK